MKNTLYTLVLLLCIPFAVNAQWEQTNGPFGALEINHITGSDSMLFASALGAGVFRSLDSGENWTNVKEANSISDNSVIHLTHEGILFATDSGIVRSDDFGDTWTSVNNGLLNNNVRSIASDTAGIVYAATTSFDFSEAAGVFRYDDNGQTWSQVLDIESTEVAIIHVADDGTVWFGGSFQIWRSDDQGTTWTQVSQPITSYFDVTDIDTDSEGTVYLTTGYMNGAWKSVDSGATWSEIIPASDIGLIPAVTVDDDDEVFVSVNEGIVRSSDGGLSWDTIFLNVMTHAVVYTIHSTGSDSLFIGSRGLLMSIDNGANWQFHHQGMIATHVSSLAVTHSGNIFATSLKLWKSDNNGDTWTDIGANTGSDHFEFIKSLETGLYLNSKIDWSEVLLRSTDEGVTWSRIAGNEDNIYSILDLQINSQGHLFILSYDALYRSTDDGTTWELIDIPGDATIQLFAIGVSDTILAYYYGGDLVMSPDNGNSWSVVNSPESIVSMLETDNEGNFYYSNEFFPTLMISRDQGISWQNISPEGNENTIISLYSHHNGDLYLSTNNGVYHTSDKGINWTDFYSDMVTPQAYFMNMDSDPSNSYMYGAHYSTGVWRSAINVDINNPQLTGSSKPILTASPNPASEYVTIRSNALSMQNNTLTLYNQFGSVVRKIEMVNSQAILSLHGLPAGLYHLQGENTASVKVVVY